MTAQIPKGMKLWTGGDGPPDDWDCEKPIAVEDDGEMSIRYGWRWNWRANPTSPYGVHLARIVAYTPLADTAYELEETMRYDENAEANRLNAMDKPIHPLIWLVMIVAVVVLSMILLESKAQGAYGTVKCTPNHTCGEHIRPWRHQT